MGYFVKKGDKVLLVYGLFKLLEMAEEAMGTTRELEQLLLDVHNGKFNSLSTVEIGELIRDIEQEQQELRGLMHNIKRQERLIKASRTRSPANIRSASCITNLR